ncbi:MAG: TAXI family TRAP transporter solute-binding subunit [Chloroflexi bacterium]|nr:TAXI family TRAP transporter solute-binding subunit [Chloroflexota bacterium]
MSTRRFSSAVGLSVVLALVLLACSEPNNPPNKGSSQPAVTAVGSRPAVARPTQGPPPPVAPQRLKLAGLSGASQAALWNSTVASVLGRRLPGLDIAVQPGDVVANVPLVEKGEAQLGTTTVGAVLGLARSDDRALEQTRLRTVWAMFDAPFHVVVSRLADTKELSDLKGKDIAIGDKSGPIYATSSRVFQALGLKESDFKILHLDPIEAAAAYRAGQLDAILATSLLPAAWLPELNANTRGLKLVPLNAPTVKRITDRNPQYTASVIPANTYDFAKEEVSTIGEWYYLTARDDVPADLVYSIARTIDTELTEIQKTVPNARLSTAENTAQRPGFKLHSGTERYLKERGILREQATVSPTPQPSPTRLGSPTPSGSRTPTPRGG